ncbi:phosphatidylethanolamine-binding protein, partial [Pseudomassariella vexata]
VALAIPPPEFGFVDSGNHTELSLAYTHNGNTTVVQEGQLFGAKITSTKPTLALEPAKYQSVADYKGQYLILMVDPDAPTPSNPTRRFFLHWLATSMTQNTTASSPQTGRALINSTPAQVPYRGPAPPSTSSAHRYILYAFAQPENFAIPDAYSGFSNENRSDFNLDNFIKDAGLARPAAGEFYYVSSQQSVPGDFVALAGGEFPGGNGDAVF